MRKRWKTFLIAIIIIAFAIGLQYAYIMYLRPKLGIERRQVGHEEGGDRPGLILQLTGENYFAEIGNPKAPTKVVGYVPGVACHDEAIRMLVEAAKQSPDDLYVKLLKMRSAEAMQMLEQEGKEICARYEINGQDSFDLPRPDGSTAKVFFQKSPGGGGWTSDDLKMAVEQAISKAKQSSPGSPPAPS